MQLKDNLNMATPVTININMPRSDMAFIKHLGKRMG